MAQPYIGEIRMFAGSFAPAGWAMCDGSLYPIAENDALFTLVGTTFGGDGQETFGVPDLRGRVPIHMGTGPGLSGKTLGEMAGTETVTLTVNQLPAHKHTPLALSSGGTQTSPLNGFWAASGQSQYSSAALPATAMHATASSPTGGSQAHENMVPYLAVNFIISLYGRYPSQT